MRLAQTRLAVGRARICSLSAWRREHGDAALGAVVGVVRDVAAAVGAGAAEATSLVDALVGALDGVADWAARHNDGVAAVPMMTAVISICSRVGMAREALNGRPEQVRSQS